MGHQYEATTLYRQLLAVSNRNGDNGQWEGEADWNRDGKKTDTQRRWQFEEHIEMTVGRAMGRMAGTRDRVRQMAMKWRWKWRWRETDGNGKVGEMD